MSLFNKIKAIKDLRQQAKSMQSVLAEQKIEVEHKGVKIAMDGNMRILSFSLPDELLKIEKKRDAESAVKDAIDEVIKKAQRVMAEKMKEMGGLEKLGL